MALDNEKLTERPALTNSQDTDIIHVVRGNFSYQKEAQNFNAGSITSLNDVGDVNVTGTPDDYYLQWNGTQWVAQPILLEDLLDVVIDENTLADGQVIAYDTTNEEWQNIDIPTGATELDELNDVNIDDTTLADGQVLIYDNTNQEWVNGDQQVGATELDELTDVDIDNTALADGQILTYNSTDAEWENTDLPDIPEVLNDLDDVNIGTFNPVNWSVLRFNTTNTEWVATKITIPIIDDVLINNLQNGQILSYVSADAVWKNIDLPNAGVGGTGTVDYMPIWTTTNEIGDSDIFKDALNNNKYTYSDNFTIGNGGEFKIGDYNQQGDGAYITNNTTSEIEMYMDGGLAMHIDINKQVGINQPNPSEILDILGDTPNIKINNTAETDSGIIFQDSQTVSQTASIKYGSGDNDLKFYNATVERMRIMNNGKVGIGEIAPDTILHVKGGADNEVATFESTDATSLILFKDNATTIGNVTGIGAVGNEMVMYTNDIERVRITDAGFTGFNTPNANNIAHIKTTTNGRGLTIQRDSVTSGDYADLSFLISTSDATNPNTRIRAKRGNSLTDTDLEFLTDSQTRMWIKGSNGRIGIANSNPAEMLEVNGNVKADDFLFNQGKAVSTSLPNEPTGSDQVINMVSLTQAEYDAGVIAGTINATTFYIIT